MSQSLRVVQNDRGTDDAVRNYMRYHVKMSKYAGFDLFYQR